MARLNPLLSFDDDDSDLPSPSPSEFDDGGALRRLEDFSEKNSGDIEIDPLLDFIDLDDTDDFMDMSDAVITPRRPPTQDQVGTGLPLIGFTGDEGGLEDFQLREELGRLIRPEVDDFGKQLDRQHISDVVTGLERNNAVQLMGPLSTRRGTLREGPGVG